MNKRQPIIYLSGPMSGVKDLNIPLFNKITRQLRRKGYKVVNPPELDKLEKRRTWEGCLRRDLTFVVKCDDIATLPNWTKSRGATLEVHVGKALNMPVHPYMYYLKKKRRIENYWTQNGVN